MGDASDKLVRLPCNHCGAPDPVFYPNDVADSGNQMGMPGTDAFYGHCDGCGADGPVGESMAEAIELWNRRTALPATRAEQFKLAQMFALIEESDATGSLKRYLAQHGITPPPYLVENPNIEGTELMLMLDAYATDGTNGYEFHLQKIVAYIKEKRFGLNDFRVDLVNAALALQYLATHPANPDNSQPFNQSHLATLARSVDDVGKRIKGIDGPGHPNLAGASAALRFFSVGRSRPTADTSRFSAPDLLKMAHALEAAITHAVEF
jgi:hypothetical protein